MAYVGIGVMSGSSLDGLELSCVVFKGSDDNDVWSHQIIKTKFVPYTKSWAQRLRSSPSSQAVEMAKLSVDYGHLIGTTVKEFIIENNLNKVQFIATHGYTVFHQPENGFTFQIGDGETIASHINALVVTNFRSKNVALGGTGSPLFNIGEVHLFGQYNVFLDLGGIATLSLNNKSFEVCPCNMLLNYLARKHDSRLQFVPSGEISHAGVAIPRLLEKLNKLDYYALHPPKSLSREWFESKVVPLLDAELEENPARDLLRTALDHITEQITSAVLRHAVPNNTEHVRLERTFLVSGGGAFNDHLVDTLKDKMMARKLNITFLEVDPDTMRFREATILSFLGLRCLLSMANVSGEVTGAPKDIVAGSIHLPQEGVPFAILDSDQYSFSFRRRSSSTAGSLNAVHTVDDKLAPALGTLDVNRGPMYHRASWPVPKPNK